MTEPDTLRSFMEAGDNPLDGLNDDEIIDLARDAILEAKIRAGKDHTEWWARIVAILDDDDSDDDEIAEAISLAWGYELADDREVRDWLIGLLPSGLVAALQVEGDMEARPFELASTLGTYACGTCGQIKSGPYISIVARKDVDMVGGFCVDCQQAAIDRARHTAG